MRQLAHMRIAFSSPNVAKYDCTGDRRGPLVCDIYSEHSKWMVPELKLDRDYAGIRKNWRGPDCDDGKYCVRGECVKGQAPKGVTATEGRTDDLCQLPE